MAVESGEKTVTFITKTKAYVFIPLLLRILAFVAATSATLVMAINKESETFVVATVGTTPIKATLTAKFNHTPAFVYFVIANAIAGFHSLLMLPVEYFGHKFDIKGLRFAVIPTLDVLIVALVSGGAAAAAFMGEVGRNGNSHARWNKTCDKFNTFCDRASVAMLASFITLLLLIIITIFSIFKLQIRKSISYTTLP